MNENLLTIIEINDESLKFLTLLKNEKKQHKIIAKNTYKNYGTKQGYIVNLDIFLKNFKTSLSKYQKQNKIKVEEVILSLNTISNKYSVEKVIQNTFNKIDIDQSDIDQLEKKALDLAQKNERYQILDHSLLKIKFNGYEYYFAEEVVGLETKKIESEYWFIYVLKNHYKIFERVFEEMDLILREVFFGPVLVSKYLIPFKDREYGFFNLNISDTITNLNIWENGNLVFSLQIPYGKIDILKEYIKDNNLDIKTAEKEIKKINDPKKIKEIFKTWIELVKKELEKYNPEYRIYFPAGFSFYGDNFFKTNLLEKILVEEEFLIPFNDALKNKRIFDSIYDYTNLYASALEFLEKEEQEFNLLKWIKKIWKKKAD